MKKAPYLGKTLVYKLDFGRESEGKVSDVELSMGPFDSTEMDGLFSFRLEEGRLVWLARRDRVQKRSQMRNAHSGDWCLVD